MGIKYDDTKRMITKETLSEALEEVQHKSLFALSDASMTFAEIIERVFKEAYYLGYKSNKG